MHLSLEDCIVITKQHSCTGYSSTRVLQAVQAIAAVILPAPTLPTERSMATVALGLGIYGAVNASIALIDKIRTSLVNLKKGWKDAKNVPLQLHKLLKLSVQVGKVVEKIEAKLDCYPPNEREAIASGVIDVFQGKLQQNVEEATAALETLDKYQDSSRVRMAARMKSIFGAMTKVQSCLNEAFYAASKIETHLKLEAVCPPQTKEDEFLPHFDCPELPDNVVLDFRSDDTQEGRLLRKLLELREQENIHGVSAVGRGRGTATHGMGGVGKTTALRAICREGEVKRAFPDGICFLGFGQDTKDSDVQQQLERWVRNFGGMTTLVEMRKQSSLTGVVKQAASWLRKKAILFVCDDLWRSPAFEFGYLPLLKGLLEDAPRSKLLVSTRDQRIAEELSINCETFDTLLSDRPRARNLLGHIVFGKEQIGKLERPDIQGYIETILNVCAGLQIALCMAGRALRTEIRRVGDIRKVFDMYASQVEHDQRPDEMQRGAQLYDHGLSYIVDASLAQCEQWNEKSVHKVNVQNLFRSLCVLEKQMVMPRSMLSMMWGLSSRETDRVVHKFADLGLVTKTMDTTTSERNSNEIAEDYGVRLHDLVLVLCQEMAVDEQEERHASVIAALKRSKSVWIGEEIPTLAEWWRLKDNDYIYGNLSRHMVKCGQKQALAKLLSHVRWTLRRVEYGGWLAMKMDFELLLADDDYADMRQVYGVLKRHWSEFSDEERFLGYYIGGSLSGRERKNKYTVMYMDSMTEHLSRPFLVPRSKFLGAEDSREMSLLGCRGRSSRTTLMDFSRSTDIAVLVDSYDEVSVWSVSAQKKQRSFSLPDTWECRLTCVAMSANGELIVSGHDDGTFMQWDARTGEPVGDWVEAHSEDVTCLAISKDGSTIVTGSKDGSLRLWNTKNGEPKGMPMHHTDDVDCVAICEGKSMIVTGSGDGTVCRWNMETCAMIGDPMCGHEIWVTSVAVDEKGEMIVSGSEDGTLIRWDAKTGKQIGEPMCGHSEGVRCAAISACGKMIVSGSLDKTVRMWDAVNGKQMGESFRGHSLGVGLVRFTEESSVITSGSIDGTIRRWSTAHNTRISRLTASQRCEGRVTNILLANEGQKVVTIYGDGTLLQWDAKNDMTIGKPMKGRFVDVESIAVNARCGWILAVYTTYWPKIENEVVLWDSRACEMVHKSIVVNQQSRLTCASVSSNGKMIVMGSSDGTLQRYCTTTGEAKGEALRGHKGFVTCIAFSPNDEMIVSGSRDKSIIRWVAANGEQIGEPLLHDQSIRCFSISGDGKVIVSSTRNYLFRWDTISGELLGNSVSKQGRVDDVWTNYAGNKTVTWSTDDRTIKWWSVEPGDEIRETSTLPLSNSIAKCAFDMIHGVAALGLRNGAVAFCDIHW